MTAFASDVNVINNGSIATQGDGDIGLNLNGINVTTSGSGSIVTDCDQATSVFASGQNLNVKSRRRHHHTAGPITTSGTKALGVNAASSAGPVNRY